MTLLPCVLRLYRELRENSSNYWIRFVAVFCRRRNRNHLKVGQSWVYVACTFELHKRLGIVDQNGRVSMGLCMDVAGDENGRDAFGQGF